VEVLIRRSPVRLCKRGVAASLGALLVSLLTLGCSGGSDPVFPPGGVYAQDIPTLFQLRVTYADTVLGSEPRLIIQATLQPGLAAGEVREVLDPALRVMGLELQGDRGEVQHGGGLVTPVYRYESAMAVPDEDFSDRPLTFVPPVVEGSQPDFGPIEWFGIARSGPDTIHLLPGEDLRLMITNGVRRNMAPALYQDGIVILESGESRMPIRLPAYPDGPIVIDREDLPAPSEGRVRARLRVSTSRASDRIPVDAYHIEPSLSVELAWEVVLLANGHH
jgi:hypothetical protein